MSAKKKKKPGAAQNLIDSLLDEQTPAPKSEPSISEVVQLREDDPHPEQTVTPESGSVSDAHFGEDEIFVSVADHQLDHALELEHPEPVDVIQGGATKVEKPPPLPASKQARVIDATGAFTKTPPALPRADDVTTTGVAAPSTPSQTSSSELEHTVRLDAQTKKSLEQAKTQLSNSEATVFETSLPPARYTKSTQNEPSKVDPGGLTDLKTIVKMRGGPHEKPQQAQQAHGQRPASGAYTSTEAALRQSESLRIAQSRISELEGELERLRRENERLATAGETLGRRADELISKLENIELQGKESDRIHSEEKKVFRGQVQSKDREIQELKARLEEMEARLEGNFKKIRVRERELEHRLEINRIESQTLVATKDKMILELKRQIDQLTHENDYGKQKSQELYNQYKDKQETVRRVVRALRIALTILEGDEDASGKKPE